MTDIQPVFDYLKRVEVEQPDKVVACATICGLAIGYQAKWRGQEWRAESVEKQFLLPIINPATSSPSRTHTYNGRMDAVVTGHGKRLHWELKTTSEDIADPNGPFWRRLAIDSQVSHYAVAAHQMGQPIDGTLYDVIRKPQSRPRQLTKADCKEIADTGMYCGWQVEPVDVAPKMVETPQLYSVRLASDCISRPDYYFGRRIIARMESDLVEYLYQLWEVSDWLRRVRHREKTAGIAAWFQNDAACMNYGTPCEFLGICSGYDSPTSDNWKPRGSRIEDPSGGESLSISRIKCAKTCLRKHYYRYELGIERVRDDDAEPLWFGRLVHEAIGLLWGTLNRGDGNGGSDGLEQAGNEDGKEPAAADHLACG